jgi:hypothetical protein
MSWSTTNGDNDCLEVSLKMSHRGPAAIGPHQSYIVPKMTKHVLTFTFRDVPKMRKMQIWYTNPDMNRKRFFHVPGLIS